MRSACKLIALVGFLALLVPTDAWTQSAYGPDCDDEEVRLLKSARFTDPEIRAHCSGNAGTVRYNWEICRHDRNECRPSNACVATRQEMNAVIERNRHVGVWYTTGTRSRVCGRSAPPPAPAAASAAAQKFRWEICRHDRTLCRPSNACVATRKEMNAVIERNGHVDVWYTTGVRAGPC